MTQTPQLPGLPPGLIDSGETQNVGGISSIFQDFQARRPNHIIPDTTHFNRKASKGKVNCLTNIRAPKVLMRNFLSITRGYSKLWSGSGSNPSVITPLHYTILPNNTKHSTKHWTALDNSTTVNNTLQHCTESRQQNTEQPNMTVNNSARQVLQSAVAWSLWRVAVHCDTRGHQPALLPQGSGAPPRLERETDSPVTTYLLLWKLLNPYFCAWIYHSQQNLSLD